MGAVQQVFCQPAAVGQGAHVLSAMVLSDCVGDQTRRAQKTLQGKGVWGREKEEGEQGKSSCLAS